MDWPQNLQIANSKAEAESFSTNIADLQYLASQPSPPPADRFMAEGIYKGKINPYGILHFTSSP